LVPLCLAAGVDGLLVHPTMPYGFAGRGLALALTAVGFGGLLQLLALPAFGSPGLIQLMPMPDSVTSVLSANSGPVLRQLDPVAALGLRPWHPLSIDPAATRMALALYAAFAVFLLGFTRLLSIVGPRRFADALTIAAV